MTPLELLKTRHSVRSFTDQPVDPSIIRTLKAEVTMINTHEAGIKFRIITDDPEPLKGFSHSYGVFKNPRNYLVGVVDTALPDIYERAGYFAEQFVMKAVECGLGTCFVGGTYNSSKVSVPLRAGEKILFLVLFGYPAGKARPMARLMAGMVHLKKMKPRQFFIPEEEVDRACEEFPMLSTALEAVVCAPSAVNRRPTRLYIGEVDGERTICAKVEKPDPSTLIDLGIAKYNVNYATGEELLPPYSM
jgi:nitroreductase